MIGLEKSCEPLYTGESALTMEDNGNRMLCLISSSGPSENISRPEPSLSVEVIIISAFLQVQWVQILLQSSSGQIQFDADNKWRFGFFKMEDRDLWFWSFLGLLVCVETFADFFAIDIAERHYLLSVIRCQTPVQLPPLLSRVPDREWGPVLEDSLFQELHPILPDCILWHGVRRGMFMVSILQEAFIHTVHSSAFSEVLVKKQ